jgi:uncharacterized tellurite resistance protein B-like protein
MIDKIKALIFGNKDEGNNSVISDSNEDNELAIAAIALLIEAAVMDGNFDDKERQVIANLISGHFGLNSEDTQALIDTGQKAAEQSNQLYAFASVIKQGFEVEDRAEMIEMLWEVACADGKVHDYEANLVRRVAGLIHVSDRESGEAKKRAMDRQNMNR